MKRVIGGIVGRFALGGMICAAAAGCGPTTFTKTRFEVEPYTAQEMKQTRDGITIERVDLRTLPAEFSASVQKCNIETGQLYVDSQGQRMMETRPITPLNSWVEKVNVTNNTGHIVRLSGTVMALFDPADNQYDGLSKGDIASHLQQERPCSSTAQLADRIATVKLIDRNTEFLPNRTTTGYLVFMPRDPHIRGIWKMSFYEVPVETDAAGRPSRTVNFDFRTMVKQYRDTYRRENALASPVKTLTEEIN